MYESFRILKTGAQKIKTETVRILILLIEEIIIVSKKKRITYTYNTSKYTLQTGRIAFSHMQWGY